VGTTRVSIAAAIKKVWWVCAELEEGLTTRTSLPFQLRSTKERHDPVLMAGTTISGSRPNALDAL
jgi:hypothetical protein